MNFKNYLLKERMRLDYLHAAKLKNIGAEKTLKTMFDLNDSMQDLIIDQIKKENPNISEKMLIKKMRTIFWSCRK